MATAPLAISLTSVLGGISTATAESGVAVLAAMIAGIPLLIVGTLWKKVLLSFRGSAAAGTVTRTEPAGGRQCRVHISFVTADGTQVTVPLTASQRTRPGDRVGIRYDPAKPEFATNRLAGEVVTHFLLPIGALIAVGLAGLIGTLYTSATGGFDGFLNGYAVVVFVVIAVYAFWMSYLRYGERDDQVQDVPGETATATRGSASAGAILTPILVGLIMLALAVIFAVGS
jgi:hypothetical protein